MIKFILGGHVVTKKVNKKQPFERIGEIQFKNSGVIYSDKPRKFKGEYCFFAYDKSFECLTCKDLRDIARQIAKLNKEKNVVPVKEL